VNAELMLVAVAGIVMIVWAGALRFGWLPVGDERKAKVWHQVYSNPRHPYRERSVTGALLMSGIGTLAIAIAAILMERSASPSWYFVAPFAVSLVAFGFALRYWFRPPPWSHPDWLREELRRREACLPSHLPVPAEGNRPTMSRRELALGWTLAAVGTAGVFILDWPPAILFGVGTWLSLVVITKVR
jgi:hypothetical protein